MGWDGYKHRVGDCSNIGRTRSQKQPTVNSKTLPITKALKCSNILLFTCCVFESDFFVTIQKRIEFTLHCKSANSLCQRCVTTVHNIRWFTPYTGVVLSCVKKNHNFTPAQTKKVIQFNSFYSFSFSMI